MEIELPGPCVRRHRAILFGESQSQLYHLKILYVLADLLVLAFLFIYGGGYMSKSINGAYEWINDTRELSVQRDKFVVIDDVHNFIHLFIEIVFPYIYDVPTLKQVYLRFYAFINIGFNVLFWALV